MTDPGLEVRATLPEDAADIRTIAGSAGVFSTEEIATVDELLQAYLSQGPQQSGYAFLSCIADRRVVGFACYGPRALTQGTYDLYWIATNRTAGRQGVGGALSARVAHEVKAQGGRLVVAETSGLPTYEPARRFYESHGYERAATIPDFYAPGDDMIIYVLRV
jgi:ribosomal protein S18 acetylase RimI-like enzyme